MREELKSLEKLQQVDMRLLETRQLLTSLPARLQSLKDDVDRVEALLEGERQQLAEVKRYRSDRDVVVKSDHDQQSKLKSKLSQVRTSKEYMALQRELEASRKSTQERDEELLKLMAAVEQSQKTIAVHEEELKVLKAHVAEEEAETEARLRLVRAELEQQQGARDKMATSVPKDLLASYDWIRQRRGNAVVVARHGICTGCNMHLPPQLFRILQSGQKIESCPSCHRIVYYEASEG